MTLTSFRAGVAICGLALLTACGDSERAAVEQYFLDMEPIAQTMSDVGIQFETMMNIQANVTDWTEEEKNEVREIDTAMMDLRSDVEAVSVPATLADVHPVLEAALTEMHAAVTMVLDIAEDPSKATEAGADEMMAKAEKGEQLANEYLQKLETAVAAKYPDLLGQE